MLFRLWCPWLGLNLKVLELLDAMMVCSRAYEEAHQSREDLRFDANERTRWRHDDGANVV